MIFSLGDRSPVFEGQGHFVAPDASIIGSVRLESRASVWFGAVLRGDNDWIVIGENSNIQDGAILHTDPGIRLVVGANVTVGHRVTLHGCQIGDNSLIGIGSTVLNNARIGRNTVVGAHSLVTEEKTFPDGVLLLGSPAKIVRELNAQELEMLKTSADLYTRQNERYRRDLTELDELRRPHTARDN